MSASREAVAQQKARTWSPTHHWCCDPNISLCGHPIQGRVVASGHELNADTCSMCADMIESDAECSPGCHDRYGIAS